MKIEKPKRVYTYCNKLYFTYKYKYEEGTAMDNTPMHGWNEWAVYIGFNPMIFNIDNFYYDGHTTKNITLLGITVGKIFTYSWGKK